MNKRKEDTIEAPKRAPMDFGELRNDTDFITKSINLEKVSARFVEFFYFIANKIRFHFNLYLFIFVHLN